MKDKLPMSDKIKYHSVIGSISKAGIPCESTHLDRIESAFVVKSGHSAQKEPLAIQEIRHMSLAHLRQYPNPVLSSPLFFNGRPTTSERGS